MPYFPLFILSAVILLNCSFLVLYLLIGVSDPPASLGKNETKQTDWIPSSGA